jgi:DNA replication protein DnaC
MIEKLLAELKMTGALNYWKVVKEKKATWEIFEKLLSEELISRQIRQTERRLSSANFSGVKEWAEIKAEANPKIDFSRPKEYSNGQFVEEKRNLCFLGASGLGKTHCMISIGRELCRLGYKVKFYAASDLINQLEEKHLHKELNSFMKQLIRPDFLIIDELGFIPLSDNSARPLFDVFSSRYEKGSIGVTTNVEVTKWTQIFGELALTAALVDRFMQDCDTIVFRGVSHRVAHAKDRKSTIQTNH